MNKKCILIVLDSLGIGALPDAPNFGDEGSDTFGALLRAKPDLKIPNLRNLGFGNIQGVALENEATPQGCFARAKELFPGKDTTGGHWEIAGCILDRPFPVFPNGFPKELMDEFEQAIGRKTLGNYAASGTEIIKDLGDEHMRTGYPIVYTSADSVFQIAAHEDVIPVDQLYEICLTARRLLQGQYRVGRVIARPFIGQSGGYTRTGHRKDFSVEPPAETMLDALKTAGLEVAGVGKIEDIFANRGLTKSDHQADNDSCVQATLQFALQPMNGLIFSNLVDFDSVYGHRNNALGYAQALEKFDEQLPSILATLQEEDLLIITADHGCDPETESTDHSREYTPIVCYGKNLKQGIDLGTRESFADIGATVIDYFGLEKWHCGQSFLPLMKKGC